MRIRCCFFPATNQTPWAFRALGWPAVAGLAGYSCRDPTTVAVGIQATMYREKAMVIHGDSW